MASVLVFGRDAFGSAFWHNGARSTWYAKLISEPEQKSVQLGLYNRKANLGALRSAVGFETTFSEDATSFRRVNLAHVPDLAAKLSVRQRIATALQGGAMTAEALATETQAEPETVKRTLRRYRQQFLALNGGYYGLAQRDR